VLAAAALIWWPSAEKLAVLPTPSVIVPISTPAPAPAPTPPPAPLRPPAIEHPIEAIVTPPAPAKVPLPGLDGADAYVRGALAGFISTQDIVRFLQLGHFVRHIVATVDNLPRESAAAALWPVAPTPGRFSTGAGDGTNPLGPTTIHANNNARYTPFVAFIASVDTARAVSLYVQLYPLFQHAYVELGYPSGYFNDRLIAVIDHLLAAPVHVAPLEVSRVEIKGPYPSVRPWITYEFTDAALRAMSSGQKMLLRTGAVNHQRLRTKLIDFRAHLTKTALAQPDSSTSK